MSDRQGTEMLALVIESRPRSVRYNLFSMDEDEAVTLIISGRVTGIGSENPLNIYDYGKQGRGEGGTLAENHWEALARIASVLSSRTTGETDFCQNLSVVAHRVPHGGQEFRRPVLLTEQIAEQIDLYGAFAPRGNGAALEGIHAAANTFPATPHVAVFDTAFHQSMPPEAYLYALPYELYEREGLRRFGFHSVTHRHSIMTAASELGTFPEALKVISLYLDEETSASAFAQGRCIDTTSGLAIHSGLPGGSIAGAIDPAAIAYLQSTRGLGTEELEDLLSKSSGVLGLSGVSADLLEVVTEADKGDERCRLTIGVFVHQVVRALGGLIAVMGGLDLLVFTGRISCHSPRIRAEICVRLDHLGLAIDPIGNELHKPEAVGTITAEDSEVPALVVPDDDEVTIARDSLELVREYAEG